MTTSNLFFTNYVSGNNYTNDFVMPLLCPIDDVNSSVSIQVVNVSYPKSVTNIDDNELYIHFSFSYKKCSPYKAKGLRPFKPVYGASHSSKNLQYLFEQE